MTHQGCLRESNAFADTTTRAAAKADASSRVSYAFRPDAALRHHFRIRKASPLRKKSPNSCGINFPIEVGQKQTDGCNCGQWEEWHPADSKRHTEWPRVLRQTITQDDQREIHGEKCQKRSEGGHLCQKRYFADRHECCGHCEHQNCRDPRRTSIGQECGKSGGDITVSAHRKCESRGSLSWAKRVTTLGRALIAAGFEQTGRTANGYATWLAHGAPVNGWSISEVKGTCRGLATAIPTKKNSVVISIARKATKCRKGS